MKGEEKPVSVSKDHKKARGCKLWRSLKMIV